jgi:predicted O-methyltransferase YrrM
MRLRDRLSVAAIAKEIATRTRLRNWIFFRYDFMFTPAQLAFLCAALSSVEGVPGSVLEIGCAFGNTTVFLNRHMDAEGIRRRYFCIDTFSGFTSADIAREHSVPGAEIEDNRAFRVNSRRWFETTMAVNGIQRVEAFQADATAFDYRPLSPIAFALVDVDLYRAVSTSLNAIWPNVSPGGIVVVDDCATALYPGALFAYEEFRAEQGLPAEIECGKLGVLRKSH